MSNVVHLEAFEAPLRGRRLRWFLAHGQPISYPPGFQEQCFIESPPFQRRILVMSHVSSEAWKLVDKWDGILVPATGADWSLVLAVTLNQPAPCLLVLTPEVKAPQAVFQKFQQQGVKSPSIVWFQNLVLPVPPSPVSFDATFFPPSSTMEDQALESTQAVLQQLLSSETLRTFVLKDAIRDLRGAGATLVVSGIEEQFPTLYWYYAAKHKTEEKPLLSSIVQTLLLRDK